MSQSVYRSKLRVALTLALGASVLVATGCAGGNAERSADSRGVDFGATMGEYHAAFESVDPITIRTQTAGAQGSLVAQARSAYNAALEEWSNGKIQVEMAYASGFVPDALEWDTALADGRLDIALVLPAYKPEVYPLWADLSTASVLDSYTSTGPIIATGWMSEVGWSEPYVEELSQEGLQLLLPQTATYGVTAMFCADPINSLEDFEGKQVSASGTLKSAEIRAMGATPVAMPFTDQYEALERGLISCALTGLSAVSAGGLEPLTPWVLLDPQVAFESTASTMIVGQQFWEGLPLVAQQLIFDRLDVMLTGEFAANALLQAELLEALRENGGGVVSAESKLAAAVNSANAASLADLVDIETYEAASGRWTEIVVDRLAYGNEGLAEWLESGRIDERDMQPFIDELFERVLLPHRPS